MTPEVIAILIAGAGFMLGLVTTVAKVGGRMVDRMARIESKIDDARDDRAALFKMVHDHERRISRVEGPDRRSA